ncbi:regulatory protein-like [Oryza sativa Japonica Group]|uniref:Regulatory protein-like n=2 Tax=Oryza sativa subsp. japonica TaxID=39947 RepID=Q5JLL6_ORYSJ|nr:regulatory protein-like [Oryza sativa Japonica Group]BAD88366.1 regulatory protein-like [Oryza sativa Japonica Group]
MYFPPGLLALGNMSGHYYHHLTSFLLGAVLPTVLLFFLASDRVSERLPTISSLGNGALVIGGRATAREGGDLTGVDGSAPAPAEKEKFPGLAELLPEVAMEDKTVIITSVNDAWAAPGSLLDLFRDSFHNGDGIAHLLDHVLVVAVDAGGFRRCKAVHPHCYLLDVPGHGGLRRLLRVPPRRRQGVHGARQLLRRAGEQGARPQERARRLEELHGRPDVAGEEGCQQVQWRSQDKVIVGAPQPFGPYNNLR